jgi:hypothetical protein
MKILSSGSRVVLRGRSDRHEEADRRFRNLGMNSNLLPNFRLFFFRRHCPDSAVLTAAGGSVACPQFIERMFIGRILAATYQVWAS